ncbi:MAG TPA: cache domain-containing protein, partial [Rhodocyclaceae bacterium]|nr:cache domain-containing protein [Rhodocyclaceae bacterium]
MKLSTRLILVTCFAALGMAVVSAFALFSLRDTMVEERQAGVDMLVRLAAKQIQRYVELEKTGKLSREDAQATAKEAMRGLRDGGDYVFVRSGDKLTMTLVHPDPSKEGKESDGGKLPNGSTTVAEYLKALGNGNHGIALIYTKRPTGPEDALPKINVIQRIPEWGWVVGSGVFIDDVNKLFWQRVVVFSLIGGVVLLIVVGLVVGLARGIYRSLGGEPSYAAHVAQVITAGDMSHE